MRADLLIREANQRMRRRRLLLAVLLASVLALSIGLTVALRSAGSPALAGAVWLPHGVREIDIRSQTFASHPHSLRHPFSPRPPLSLRITDPSEVARIAGWFNALVRSPREVRLSDGATVACVNGIPATVEFTFRGASGKKLATANSTPGMAWYCAAIQFTAGAHRAAFLLDRFTLGVDPSKLSGRDEANSFIGRVQELLGVKFQQSPVILG
jgi:hypothetical protein